jgi:hypothetical protein
MHHPLSSDFLFGPSKKLLLLLPGTLDSFKYVDPKAKPRSPVRSEVSNLGTADKLLGTLASWY